jgi:hypothetical protein
MVLLRKFLIQGILFNKKGIERELIAQKTKRISLIKLVSKK